MGAQTSVEKTDIKVDADGNFRDKSVKKSSSFGIIANIGKVVSVKSDKNVRKSVLNKCECEWVFMILFVSSHYSQPATKKIE